MHYKIVSICFFGVMISCSSVVSAVTNWETKGIADTTRVRNVVQLTPLGGSLSFLMGGDRPQDNEVYNVQPWNSSGSYLTFTSRFGGDYVENDEICIIAIDGDNFTRLTNNNVSDHSASFSDDEKIYFTHVDNNPYSSQIWRLNGPGLGSTDLSAAHYATNDEYNAVPSPDGTKVAYIDEDLQQLYVANADGTSPVKVSGKYGNPAISDIVVYNDSFSWSPDSNWLVYTGAAEDVSAEFLYKTSAQGYEVGHLQLTVRDEPSIVLYHQFPTWSPDGTKIAYRLLKDGDTDFHELRIISAADGSGIQVLDTANEAIADGWTDITVPASWSPDSRWLAYGKMYQVATYNDHHAIVIIDTEADTPSPIVLTEGYYDYFPIWSPVGNRIVFQSAQERISREDDCDPSCTENGDILILNLNMFDGDSSFPWPMFFPAIQGSDR